jgi:hypothetical protein
MNKYYNVGLWIRNEVNPDPDADPDPSENRTVEDNLFKNFYISKSNSKIVLVGKFFC